MAVIIVLLILAFIIYKIFGFLNSVSAPTKSNTVYDNRVLYNYKDLLTQFSEFHNENLIPDEIYNKIKEDLLNNQTNAEVLKYYNDKLYTMNRGGRLDRIREYRKLLLNGVITKEDYLKKRDEEIRKHYVVEYEVHFFKGDPIPMDLEPEEGWDAVYKKLESMGMKDYEKNIDYILRKRDSARIFKNEQLGEVQRYIAYHK